MTNAMYHYKECGLSGIYLENGFQIKHGSRGKTVHIENIDGLHDAIGYYLATQKKHLDGREARFLRHEMGLSQAMLALLLGKDEQSVARWEKKNIKHGNKIPSDSERMIRLLYLEHLGGHPKIKELLQQLAEMEERELEDVAFSETETGWETAA